MTRSKVLWRTMLPLAAALAVVTAACGSDDSDSSATTAAPAATTAAPAATTAAPAATTAAPATSGSGATTAPAGNEDTAAAERALLEPLAEAAKAEGKLTVWAPPQPEYADFIKAFEETYPDIDVTIVQGETRELVARYQREAEAGLADLDVFVGALGTANGQLVPAGLVEPLKPMLLPEIVDGENWQGGELLWLDEDQQHIAGPATEQFVTLAVNEDIADDIKEWDDLLDPAYKGKIVTVNPLDPGPGLARALQMYYDDRLGPEFTERFFTEADPQISADEVSNLEQVIDGRMLATLNPNVQELENLSEQGIEVHVIPNLTVDGEIVNGMTTAGGGIWVPSTDRPNPKATELFANWVFSHDGGQAMVDRFGVPSRRVGVDLSTVNPDVIPLPDVEYAQLELLAQPATMGPMLEDLKQWVG